MSTLNVYQVPLTGDGILNTPYLQSPCNPVPTAILILEDGAET